MSLRIALFDLDNTLLRADSDIVWTSLLAEKDECDLAVVERYHREYAAGTLDIAEFLDFQIGTLARLPRETLLDWRAEFVARTRPHLAQDIVTRAAEHAAAGHVCALVTATNRFLVEPLAELAELPHVVATEPEIADGRFTGRWLPPPCFRAGKVARVGSWLAALGSGWPDVAESWFYSDSHNDLPLLSRVTHAVCVRPDVRLAEQARERGWTILA